MKIVWMMGLFWLTQCKTVPSAQVPIIPTTMDFTGYNAKQETTYCSESLDPNDCEFSKEAKQFFYECNNAQRCPLGQACTAGELIAFVCKDCTVLCSENPHSPLFKQPSPAK